MAAALLISPGLARADRIVFVNAALQSGSGDGTSWSSAFRGRLGLRAAIDAAVPGNEIWVAAGVYAPAPAGGSRAESFLLKPGVAILGGFRGLEVRRDQRDPAVNTTVLTGDLAGNGSATSAARADNVFHIVVAPASPSADGASVLDGFTITGGATPSGAAPGSCGGGVQILAGSPVIRTCIFDTNRAEGTGGDVYIGGGAAVLESCTFLGRSVAPRGLAVSHSLTAAATLRGCRFIGSPPTTGGMAGVGVWTDSGAPAGLTVEDCLFSMTTAAFSCPAGVGIYAAAGTRLTVTGSRFISNQTCGGGGGIHTEGQAVIDRCVFAGNEGRFDGGAALFCLGGRTVVLNSVFTGNDRTGFTTIAAQGEVRAANCTFAFNGAATGTHGVVQAFGPPVSFVNCVFWGNTTGGTGDGVVIRTTAPLPAFDSSLVQGWNGTLPGAGSFAADPVFADEVGPDGVRGTGDERLAPGAGSPCIDRGDSAALRALGPMVTLDAAGGPRFVDDPATPDSGPGPGARVDLGAYEFQPALCAADFNRDGVVGIQDLFDFLGAYFANAPAADVDRSGAVTVQDIFAFIQAFFAGC